MRRALFSHLMKQTLEGKSRQEAHEDIRKTMLKGKLKKKGIKYKLSGAAADQVVAFEKNVLRPALKNLKVKVSEKDLFKSASV